VITIIWIALIVLVLFVAVMGRVQNRRRQAGGEAGDDPGSLHHGHHGHQGHNASSGGSHHGGGFSGGGHHG
jgi:uncharacterized membrane protein